MRLPEVENIYQALIQDMLDNQRTATEQQGVLLHTPWDGRWLPADKVELTDGGLYVVRQVWRRSPKAFDSPAVYRWAKKWEHRAGPWLCSTHAEAYVEVLVPKIRKE